MKDPETAVKLLREKLPNCRVKYEIKTKDDEEKEEKWFYKLLLFLLINYYIVIKLKFVINLLYEWYLKDKIICNSMQIFIQNELHKMYSLFFLLQDEFLWDELKPIFCSWNKIRTKLWDK